MQAILVALLSLHATFTLLEADEFDLPLVLDATGVPECIDICLSDLFYSAADLVYLENPIQKFRDFCRSYDNALVCVENHKDSCMQTSIFDIALSGIDEICHEREEDVMQHKECLEMHTEVVMKGCNHVCNFTDVMIMLSGKGKYKNLQKLQEDHEAMQRELASACTTFGCMAACVARDFNEHCSPAGTIISDALLKPFFTIAQIFEEIGPRAKISIYRQVPPQCYYLVNYDEVHGISAGRAPNMTLFANPEQAVLNEITTKEDMKRKKKAELEKQFLMEAQWVINDSMDGAKQRNPGLEAARWPGGRTTGDLQSSISAVLATSAEVLITEKNCIFRTLSLTKYKERE